MNENLKPYSDYVKNKMKTKLLPDQIAEIFDLIGEYASQENCREIVRVEFNKKYPDTLIDHFNVMYEAALSEWTDVYAD